MPNLFKLKNGCAIDPTKIQFIWSETLEEKIPDRFRLIILISTEGATTSVSFSSKEERERYLDTLIRLSNSL